MYVKKSIQWKQRELLGDFGYRMAHKCKKWPGIHTRMRWMVKGFLLVFLFNHPIRAVQGAVGSYIGCPQV